jgi:DNA excision repair protein ERCC-6
MYHRQVFKILLSNKVLEDPRQRRLFRTTDLSELFNLNEPINGKSESDQLFHSSKLIPNQPNFTLSKIEEMRKLASALSKTIGKNAINDQSIEKKCTDGKSTEVNTTHQNCDSNSLKENGNILIDCVSNYKDTKELDSFNEQQHEFTPTSKNENNVGNNTSQEIDYVETNENDIVDKVEKTEAENLNSQITCNSTSETVETNESELEEGEIIDAPSNLPSETSAINEKSSSKNYKKITKSDKDHRPHWRHKKRIKSKSEGVSAIFEGERVSCLIGRRLGKSNEVNPTVITDDQFVLSKLFCKAGKNHFNSQLPAKHTHTQFCSF